MRRSLRREQRQGPNKPTSCQQCQRDAQQSICACTTACADVLMVAKSALQMWVQGRKRVQKRNCSTLLSFAFSSILSTICTWQLVADDLQYMPS